MTGPQRPAHPVGVGTAAEYMVLALQRRVVPAGWAVRCEGYRWVAESGDGCGVAVTAITRTLGWTVEGWVPAHTPVPSAPHTLMRVDLSPHGFTADDADVILGALLSLFILPRPSQFDTQEDRPGE